MDCREDQETDKIAEESSEDEFEIVPKSVDNFWVEDGDENPISFATLPYSKTGDEVIPENSVFLRGTQDNGMRLFVKALAWKLELTTNLKPGFHVKTDKYWIQLLKPRKSYEGTIRSIMVVAQFLNYALVNPEDSERTAWVHVTEVFPSGEEQPSPNDLASHLPLIQQLIATEDNLRGCCALQSIDTGSLPKKLASATEDGRQSSKRRNYVPDDESEPSGDTKRFKPEADEPNYVDDMDGYDDGTGMEDIGDLSETVCSICDNGGDVICCDGPCMRSFHLNKYADGASDANCSTLGFSKADVERMDKFFCPNCKHKEHQCYICGELGCSDETAGAAQKVFICDAAICGHFYHPECVAEMILKDKDKSEVAILVEAIKEGKGFVCPMHKCWKCGKGEVKEKEDLQFGICRRCPRVWHRQCFPSYLLFEATDDEPQRAWEDLLPARILVYCKRHKISAKLATPVRDHVKFPEGSLPSAKKPVGKSKIDTGERMNKLSAGDSQQKKRELDRAKISKGARRMSESDVPQKKSDSFKNIKPDVPRPMKAKPNLDGSVSRVTKNKMDEQGSAFTLSKSRPGADGSVKQERSAVAEQKSPKLLSSKEFFMQQVQKKSKPSLYVLGKPTINESEVRNVIDAIIEKTKKSVTIESVQSKHEVPICYRRNSKPADKKYSLVKIESIIRGMRKAVETLDSGGSIEDAKAKCSPAFLKHLEGCKNELKVYLAPFLHGSRYTSYGRHFTKTEKLEEIVERLHWYIKPGDMVVDFCCGANEFSILLKKKLDGTGKKCNYKNFDIIQTKSDFNFVKRDWFQVKQEELVDGNRLIMGLNPPFGVRGQLANQFIDHALKFKPKLIILIVPKETERLDQKHDNYDLIWEDLELLKGQSFYLPGSVDVDENPLSDWNAVAPPLFIWSRPDWTPTHRQIAQEQGHISRNSTPGPSRFVGNPWKPKPRAVSPAQILDAGMDKRRNLTVEPRISERSASKQDIHIKEDSPGSYRLKDMCKDEPLDKTVQNHGFGTPVLSEKPEQGRPESLIGDIDEKKAMHQSKGQDMEKIKSSERYGGHAGKLDIARHNRQRKDSPERLRQSLEAKHEGTRHGRKVFERYTRNADTKVDISKYDDKKRKSPENYLENEIDGRKSPDRIDRYGLGGRKSSDMYDRHGLIEGSGSPDRHFIPGRISPERHGKISELKNEPLSYSEQRKHSPERQYRHGLQLHENDDSRLYNEVVKHGGHVEQSLNRIGHRSGLDLERHPFSSRENGRDTFRDYDSLLKRDGDYHDVAYHRAGSPDRRPNWKLQAEDSKRSWSNYGNYGSVRASEDATGYVSKDYMDPSIQHKASLYKDSMSYSQYLPESQEGVYKSRDYFDKEIHGIGRSDGLDNQGMDRFHRKMDFDVTHNGGVNDVAAGYASRTYDLIRHKGLDAQAVGHFVERPGRTSLPGGIHSLQGLNYSTDPRIEPVDLHSRYGIQGTTNLTTKTSYHSSAGDGLLATPDGSFNHSDLSGRGWMQSSLTSKPALSYPPMFGPAASLQQSNMHLSDPSLHASHGLFGTHQGHPQGYVPLYPAQARFAGPANSQYSGGWIDD